MTRYKKELRKRGFKLECDYPFLPYSCNNQPTIEGVRTYCENNKIFHITFSVVGDLKLVIDNNFNITDTIFY